MIKDINMATNAELEKEKAAREQAEKKDGNK